MRVGLLALAVTSWVACGRYGKRVPNPVVEKLPYEIRIELLEAENDLAAAIDVVDEAQNEVGRTRVSLLRAKDREWVAWREVGEAQDARSREVAELAVQEAQARVEYLQALQDKNVLSSHFEEMALQCAQARFEVARLSAARKAKVAGSETLKPEEFEAQVKACEEELKQERASQTDEKKRYEAARASWEEKKAALAKKTFDARASPYVE